MELGKWQEKNPLKARQMMTEGWKDLGLETNPEIINQRVIARIE